MSCYWRKPARTESRPRTPLRPVFSGSVDTFHVANVDRLGARWCYSEKRGWRGFRRGSGELQQLTSRDTQGIRETVDIVEAHVTFAPLNAAHVGAVYTCEFGQCFLAQAELQTELPDAVPECDAMIALFRDYGRHLSSVGVCTL